MAEIALLIFDAVAGVREIAKRIKATDRQAHRLSERVAAIETPLREITPRIGHELSSPESLGQLLETVSEVRDFLARYAATEKVGCALKRKSNAEIFTLLGTALREGIQALHLGVAVDAWAQEDVVDRLEDIENMIESMTKTRTEMEEAFAGNHGRVRGDVIEVVRVVQELERDQLHEPRTWIEVDRQEELDFKSGMMLGSGTFGVVYTAKWRGADVAVKHVISHELPRDTLRALRKDVALHSSLHCEFLVPLLAASTKRSYFCLVMERGRESLQSFLRAGSEPLGNDLQASFLYDISRGMCFLHNKGILHRDLKSVNVLVSENDRLKLCDFGPSKIKVPSLSRPRHEGARSSYQYMSPEEWNDSEVSRQTDLYRFGILCFEVATRMEPFGDKEQGDMSELIHAEAKRPQIPEGLYLFPDVVSIMEHCWRQNPEERPDGFEPVVETLMNVVKRLGDPRGRSPPAAVHPKTKVDPAIMGGDPIRQPTESAPLLGRGVGSGSTSFSSMAERTTTDLTAPLHSTQRGSRAPLPVAYTTGLKSQVVHEEGIAQEGDIPEVEELGVDNDGQDASNDHPDVQRGKNSGCSWCLSPDWNPSAPFQPDFLVLLCCIAGLGVFVVNFVRHAETMGFAGGTIFMLAMSMLAFLQWFYGQKATAKKTITVALLCCALIATVLLVLDFVLHGHSVISLNALLPLSLLFFLVLFCDWLFLGANEVLARNGMLMEVVGCPLLLFFLAYLDLCLRRDGVDVPLLLGLTWFVVMVLLFSAMHHVDNRRACYLSIIALIEYSAIIGATVSLDDVVRSSKPREALRLPCSLLLIILGTSIVHAGCSIFESELRFVPLSNDPVGMHVSEFRSVPRSNDHLVGIWSAIAISIFGVVASAAELLYYPQLPRVLACMPVFLVSTALSVTFYLLPRMFGYRYEKFSDRAGGFILIWTPIAVLITLVGVEPVLTVVMVVVELFLLVGLMAYCKRHLS